MKSTMIACGLAGAVLAAAVLPQTASAQGCASGPYRAGCAGPRGAAVVGPNGAAAARRPGYNYGYRGYNYRGYHSYHGNYGRTCASGPNRAGCVGPHGAATVRRPY